MRIPILNVYVFTKKSFQEKQLEAEKAIRAKTNKLIADLLYENAGLNQWIKDNVKGTK